MSATTTICPLAEYLVAIGGIDKHEFEADDGRPDMDGARAFAESIRDQLAGAGSPVLVSQVNHHVRLTLPAGS